MSSKPRTHDLTARLAGALAKRVGALGKFASRTLSDPRSDERGIGVRGKRDNSYISLFTQIFLNHSLNFSLDTTINSHKLLSTFILIFYNFRHTCRGGTNTTRHSCPEHFGFAQCKPSRRIVPFHVKIKLPTPRKFRKIIEGGNSTGEFGMI